MAYGRDCPSHSDIRPGSHADEQAECYLGAAFALKAAGSSATDPCKKRSQFGCCIFVALEKTFSRRSSQDGICIAEKGLMMAAWRAILRDDRDEHQHFCAIRDLGILRS
jgi:hypothetical protein